MQTLQLSGLNRILHPEKDKRSAVERILANLSTSNYGNNDTNASKASALDTFSITQNISELLSPACGMSDEEKNRYLQQIIAKLKAGKKLTAEEMRFLQAENPQLYQQAARIQAMRDSLTASLEHCSSKKEATEIFTQAMSSVSDKDPMKEFVVAAYQDAYDEFRNSDQFESLPEETDEDKTKTNKKKAS